MGARESSAMFPPSPPHPRLDLFLVRPKIHSISLSVCIYYIYVFAYTRELYAQNTVNSNAIIEFDKTRPERRVGGMYPEYRGTPISRNVSVKVGTQARATHTHARTHIGALNFVVTEH